MVAERRFIAPPVTNESKYIFKRAATWHGVRVQHVRVRPGELPEMQLGEHEIAIPLDGAYTVEASTASGFRRLAIRSVGHTCLIPAGQPYRVRWDDELENVSIFLPPAFLSRLAAESLMTERLELIEGCGVQDPFIRELGIRLTAEIASPHPAGRLYGETLVDTLAAHLLRHYTTASTRQPAMQGGLSGHKLRRATDYINDNLSRELTLAEIANVLDLSTYHFVRAFKQATGHTPHQYLLKSRVERAKQLLAETELPLAEISYLVGFNSQSHFTASFRRLARLTPKTYRETARG
ncbi:MAG TPA: AraC family transcriptional regulator [Blastocatellia bacterium]|nr:AraC family transcriptional regulator [Blastocatellia bacterium]